MPLSNKAFVVALAGAAVALACLPAPAAADLVVFKTGRTMSVRSHSVDGGTITFTLRGGGQVACDASLVDRIDPDEVPDLPEIVAAAADASPALATEAELATRPYGALIASAAAAEGVDARLVHAVIDVESHYQPRARSRKGAKGLMQLMPDTARQYAVRDPYDAKTNIEAGVRHLKGLLSRFELSLALAAYNAGEAAILRYRGVPPFPETRDYVARVLQQLGTR